MLFFITLAIGLAGFGYAAYLDLKTTEFPDWIPYMIIIASLISRGIFSSFTGNPSFFLNSLTTGLLFLGFGLLLYYLRQWGDGDAWLLGALGFILPDAAFLPAVTLMPFPLTLLLNFFLLSFIFIIVYAIALGAHHSLYRPFLHSLKKEKSTAPLLALFLTASYAILSLAVLSAVPLRGPALVMPLLLIPLILFVKYATFLEKHAFRRKIPASQLRPGDVPAGERWKVLSSSQYRALKRSNRSIQIKEGVRLAPAFLLAFVVTLFFGNVMAFFLIA